MNPRSAKPFLLLLRLLPDVPCGCMQIQKAVEWIRAAVLTCKKGFMNGAKSNSSSAAALWMNQSARVACHHMKKIIHRFCQTRIRKFADDCFLDCCSCSCSDPLLIRIFSFRASLFWVLWVVSICGGLFPIWPGLIVFEVFVGLCICGLLRKLSKCCCWVVVEGGGGFAVPLSQAEFVSVRAVQSSLTRTRS
jgi:hypothetical protein